MDARDRLLALIEQLYAAPGTMDGWQAFLNDLRIAVDGSTASFISHDTQSRRGSITVHAQVDPDILDLYGKYWGTYDPWAYSPRVPEMAGRSVVIGDELISHADMTRTAYYHDFARHYDIVRTIAVVVELRPEALSVVSVNGSENREPFGDPEAALLRPLVPHIRRALQLHRRLIAAAAAWESLTSVVQMSFQAVVLVDCAGRVTFMNEAATRLTAMRDGLTVSRGELCAASACDTTRLRSLLVDASRTSCGEGLSAGGTLMLGRPSGRRPFVVLVSPISRRDASFPGVETAAAMVFVTDPERISVAGEDTLRMLFGLTRAEATLTRLLAEGVTLVEAGDRLGVARETVRKRLKTIFAKTNTHRQAELVRLVLSGTPSI
jgi:DNA-binding CsgD family transcriptional regulator/PAS domain-containing protein